MARRYRLFRFRSFHKSTHCAAAVGVSLARSVGACGSRGFAAPCHEGDRDHDNLSGGDPNSRGAGGLGGFKLVGMALGMAVPSLPWGTAWEPTGRECRSILTSSHVETKSSSRRTPPWKLALGHVVPEHLRLRLHLCNDARCSIVHRSHSPCPRLRRPVPDAGHLIQSHLTAR